MTMILLVFLYYSIFVHLDLFCYAVVLSISVSLLEFKNVSVLVNSQILLTSVELY